jgi:holo-[acyl-carrier protein] synthase
MIKGIGIDLVELNRIKEILERTPRFAERILTSYEIDLFLQLKGHRQIEFIAGRFAAKEAFSKALGTGIGAQLSFLHIEISKDANGKPMIRKPFAEGVHLSITHSRQYATAQVVIEES